MRGDPPGGAGGLFAAAEAMPRSAFATTAVWIAAGLCVAISVPKIARELYIMHHPQFYEVYDGGAWAGYVEVSQYLATSADVPTDKVLTPRFPVVHYLSGLPVAGGGETPPLNLRGSRGTNRRQSSRRP